MNTVDLDAKRKEKAAKCEVCGASAHIAPGMCPRVAAIYIDPEGGVTYHLWPIDEPVAG
jgi:hypothetical protein